MIISFLNNFIFLKTRKTAGTSIEVLLSSICGDDDIITMLNPVYVEHEEKERTRLTGRTFQNSDGLKSHSSINDAIKLGYKFPKFPDIFVVKRNPYSVAVSLMNWRNDLDAHHNGSPIVNIGKERFKDSLKTFLNRKEYFYDFNAKTLYGIKKDSPNVKFIRYEFLMEDMKNVFNRFDLDYSILPHFKKPINPYDDIFELLDDECISLINEKFEYDFKFFGYPMIKV